MSVLNIDAPSCTTARAGHPEPARSLVQALADWVDTRSDAAAFQFLATGEGPAETLSYEALWQRAMKIAAFLDRAGCRGEPVVLLLPSGLEFVVALFGCLAAGAVAVPAPPPHRHRGLERVSSIIADCKPQFGFYQGGAAPANPGDGSPAIRWHTVEETLEAGLAGTGPAVRDDPARPAVLQYTSGSTGDPKGIVITHGNALANIRQQVLTLHLSQGTELVSWLPVHHDMGLFANILCAPLIGGTLTMMPPTAFIQKPARWLRAISDARAAVSGAPNFAYDHCVKNIAAAEIEGVDLSSWRVAINGAEPVLPATLESFAAAFAPYGFRAESWYPCYGLAEATLLVSGLHPLRQAMVKAYRRAELAIGHVVPAPPGMTLLPGRSLVGNGRAAPGQTIRIVDPETQRELPEREIGEVWVAGENVSAGFWQRPEASAERFGLRLANDPGLEFMRTGDLGFLDEEELFVLSRVDDMIVLRGRNIAPTDIEGAALRLKGSGGCAAAFVSEAGAGPELVLVLEISRSCRTPEARAALADAAREAVWNGSEVALGPILLVRSGTIPRTTSGKVRRRATRAGFETDSLAYEFRSVPGSGTDPVEIQDAPRPEPRPGSERFLSEAADWVRNELGLVEAPPKDLPLYRLGIDSLRAAEFARWLGIEFGISIPLSELLGSASLASLAEWADSGIQARVPGLAMAWQDERNIGRHRLTRLQLGICAEQALDPGSNAYNVPVAFRLPDGLTPQRAEEAVRALARRYPLLRSRFIQDGSEILRVVDDDWAPDLPVTDLSGVPEDRWQPETVAASLAPFDLFAATPWRAHLYVWRGGSPGTSGKSVLVFTLHHVLCDGLSAFTLPETFERLLATREAEPERVELPSLDDALVAEENRYLSSAAAWADLSYWRERLGPDGRARAPSTTPRVGTDRGTTSRLLRLSPEQTERLRQAAQSLGSSTAAVLLALFATALRRLIATSEVLIGAAISVRAQSDHPDAFAPLINVLPLRCTATGPGVHFGRATLADAVSLVSRELVLTLDHARLPLSRLRESAEIGTDASRFDAAFSHLRVRGNLAVDLAEVLAENAVLRPVPFLLHPQAGPSATSLTAFEGKEGYLLSLTIRKSASAEIEIDRLAGHLSALIETTSRAPLTPIADIVATDRAGQDWLRRTETGARSPAAMAADGRSLHDLILEACQGYPDEVAIVEPSGTQATYRELAAEIDRVATLLRDRGFGPGDICAVWMGRSALWVAALIGVWRAGGAFCILDPEMHASRNAALIAECGARIVIAEESSSLEIGSTATLRLAPPGNPAAATGPPDAAETRDWDSVPAYVIFTSGSTGRPKGVVVGQGALRERLMWKVDAFRVGPGDRLLQSIPVSFDPALWEIFTPLLCGATVVLAPEGLNRNPQLLAAAVATQRITLMTCVAGMLAMIAEEFAAAGRPTMLRRIITGGEALPIAAVRRLQRACPAIVDHCYGPSEATIYCTHVALEPAPASSGNDDTPMPAGRAAAGAILRIVDCDGGAVPPGVVGEIVIGGRGLALGYLRDEAMTAAKFVSLGAEGARFYRSGDLGRWRDDGQLEVLGRLDSQIKVRGVRIEPAEVEAALAAIEGVREAAVLSLPRGETNILAAWICGDSRLIGIDSLRRTLEERLPPALVPSSLAIIDRLPRLPSGKLDRSALAQLAPASEAAASGTARETPLESRLLAIWREILQTPTLLATDDVFRQGAHSLMAMRVAGRVRRDVGMDVRVGTLFEFRTPRDQARHLMDDASVASTRRPSLVPFAPDGAATIFICLVAGRGDRRRLELLAEQLTPNVALWGMLPPAPDDSAPWTAATLVDAYAELLMARFGSRAIALSGFSTGGPFVFAITQALAARGGHVSHLILLDSAFPFLPRVNLWLYERIRGVLRVIERCLWLTFRPLAERGRQVFFDPGLFTHISTLPELEIGRYRGRVTLVRSRASKPVSWILFSPWRERVEALEIIDTAGFHGGMFDPGHVTALAAAIRRGLGRA